MMNSPNEVHHFQLHRLLGFGFDPSINITFADATDIDACLALPSLALVGPANGVPQLIRGEKIFY